ncbi:MAG: hypothetical protein V8Q17_04835 [Acutalibacteraceae bacterium]
MGEMGSLFKKHDDFLPFIQEAFKLLDLIRQFLRAISNTKKQPVYYLDFAAMRQGAEWP